MNFHMSGAIVWMCESFVTNTTYIRFFSRVYSIVSCELCRPCKHFVTLIALFSFFSLPFLCLFVLYWFLFLLLWLLLLLWLFLFLILLDATLFFMVQKGSFGAVPLSKNCIITTHMYDIHMHDTTLERTNIDHTRH